MAKIPTQWSGNPSAEADLLPYSSEDVDYSDADVTYSSVVSDDESASERVPTEWAARDREPALWLANAAADDNEYTYDSALLYDSASRTYDGVTTGENHLSEREPTEWVAA